MVRESKELNNKRFRKRKTSHFHYKTDNFVNEQ